MIALLQTAAPAVPANNCTLESVCSGGRWHRLTAEGPREYWVLCGRRIRKPARRDKWTGAVDCADCIRRAR